MAVLCNPGCHATTYPRARTFSLSLVNTLHIVFTKPTVRTIQYTDKDTSRIYWRSTYYYNSDKHDTPCLFLVFYKLLYGFLSKKTFCQKTYESSSADGNMFLFLLRHSTQYSMRMFTSTRPACRTNVKYQVRSKITTLQANNLIGRSVTPLSGQGAVIHTVAFMKTEGWKKKCIQRNVKISIFLKYKSEWWCC